MAFRRDDFRERGPLDEHFRFYRNLDLWWSLVLRDEGEDAPPRRALAIDLPLTRHEHRGWTELPDAERDRLSKRNFYRIIDRFGRRKASCVRPGSDDRSEAVLVLESQSTDDARAVLATLPFVAAGLITFDVVGLRAYPGFARLFVHPD